VAHFLTTASHGTDQLIVAETAGGAESAAIGAGVIVEWSRGLFSVRIVSFCGCNAVCLLPRSVVRIWTGGQDLSDVHCEPDAARNCGASDRGDSGCRDVELECGAELAGVEFDDGFLSSVSSKQSFRL